MTLEEKVSLATEARNLAVQAKTCIEAGSPAQAVWRLVDAAYLAWQAAESPDDLIGKAFTTGRGVRLVEEEP